MRPPPKRSGPHREARAASTAEVATAAASIEHPGTDYGVPSGHPAPEVCRRPAVPAEVPTMAAMLAETATAAGWMTSLTYARGTKIDRRGGPGKVVTSIAVRLACGPQRAVAVWEGGAFRSGWSWTTGPPTIPVAVKYRSLVELVGGAVVGDV